MICLGFCRRATPRRDGKVTWVVGREHIAGCALRIKARFRIVALLAPRKYGNRSGERDTTNQHQLRSGSPERCKVGVPLNLVQQWLDPIEISTIAIYAAAYGLGRVCTHTACRGHPAFLSNSSDKIPHLLSSSRLRKKLRCIRLPCAVVRPLSRVSVDARMSASFPGNEATVETLKGDWMVMETERPRAA
jgi:hypothetical protein